MATKRFYLRTNADWIWCNIDTCTDLPIAVDNQAMIKLNTYEAYELLVRLNSGDLQRRHVFE